jgi:two-component system NtrC family response regulator
VAPTEADVLIVGETGTGKELVARSIHKNSRRQGGRFVPVDCGAIPDDLLENEFFGHERGAFTGAHARSLGLLEFAHKGTFFLDEVGELSPRLQAKLLRVLQERSIRRVGGREEIPVDVRVVAATSRKLSEEIEAGRFREDLYYRINVARVDLPPLRERAEDVPLLVERFLERHGPETGLEDLSVDAEALELLERYAWPGNVRELQNVVRRVLTQSRDGRVTVDDLPDEIVAAVGEEGGGGGGFFQARAQRIASFEREYLENLLRGAAGEVARAAREARMPRGTLYRLLKKHDLDPDTFRGEGFG